MSAVIAIVGRPNVGKSTLFNKLLGKRQAIESEVSGTTRDRIYGKMTIDGYSAVLVDTGGLESKVAGGDIEKNIKEQSQIAIDGADVILFVLDLRSELTSDDLHTAELLRKSKKPVILVANKSDNSKIEELKYNLYELGFGEPIAVSAIHSYGVDEIELQLSSALKKLKFKKDRVKKHDSNVIRIAFIGRPNVGKSTMVNSIFEKKLLITSSIPGTTRDSIEIPFEYSEQQFVLVDTAGLRRRGDIEPGIEKFSSLRALQAVEMSDVCVLMLDFEEGVTNQDCHISQFVLEQNKGLILCVNKIDLYKGEERERKENGFIYDLKNTMAYLPWAPVVFTSGQERKNVLKILDLAMEIFRERNKEIADVDLQIWLDSAMKKHPSNSTRGKHKFEIKDVEQIGSNPPVFLFNCNWPEIMHFSYKRYLENSLRETFGFAGTGMELVFKKRSDKLGRRRFK